MRLFQIYVQDKLYERNCRVHPLIPPLATYALQLRSVVSLISMGSMAPLRRKQCRPCSLTTALDCVSTRLSQEEMLHHRQGRPSSAAPAQHVVDKVFGSRSCTGCNRHGRLGQMRRHQPLRRLRLDVCETKIRLTGLVLWS